MTPPVLNVLIPHSCHNNIKCNNSSTFFTVFSIRSKEIFQISQQLPSIRLSSRTWRFGRACRFHLQGRYFRKEFFM